MKTCTPADKVRPKLVTRSQAVPRPAMAQGKLKIFDYLGGGSQFGGAQAYLVEQTNHTVPPHFHPVDQFQVLFGAPGSFFGRRPVQDLTVHYADAYTVYGPLVGADPPLRYFTLRATPTTVTRFMPESRVLRPPQRGRRSLHAALDPVPPAGLAAAQTWYQTPLADERDGLRVNYVVAGAGAGVAIPEAGPAGQFLLVVAGSIKPHAAFCPSDSIGWQPPGAQGWSASAGSGGAVVLVLRYPRRSGGTVPGNEAGQCERC